MLPLLLLSRVMTMRLVLLFLSAPLFIGVNVDGAGGDDVLSGGVSFAPRGETGDRLARAATCIF